MSRNVEEWVGLAERRILSILKKYTACTEKQLQLKISEAGPNNQRVEPIILSKAGDNLFSKEIIESKPINVNGNKMWVYFISGTNDEIVDERVKNLSIWYDSYFEKVQYKSGVYCGNILEKMITDAIHDTGKYTYFSNVYEDRGNGIYVKADGNLNVINGKVTKNPLDCIAILNENKVPIGIEIKNKIEWKYGSDEDIWNMIFKCCELDLLPVFVSRKVPAITKFFFHKCGILGMDTQFQYLHPCCEAEFKDIIKKDKLGYAHIKFETNYRDFMKKYFNTVVTQCSQEYYERFMENKEILYEYSKELKKSNLGTVKRTSKYKEIRDYIYNKYEDIEEIEDIEDIEEML